MTAKEKELVLQNWEAFLKALVANVGKTYVDRHGNKLPEPFKKFSKRLYEHLHLHCSFIAHYSIAGFYSTYFDDPEDTIRFIKQFDRDCGVSVEYGGSYWIRGDYEDLNKAMFKVMDKYKSQLYAKLNNEEKQNDLAEANRLAGKWGYVVEVSADVLCGAWKDERTDEKIVEHIYNSRMTSSKTKPKL